MKKIIIAVLVLISGCTEKTELTEFKHNNSLTMAKRIYLPEWINPSSFKAITNVPLQSNMNVGANFIDCSVIDINAIKSALGSGSNDVSSLCQAGNMNKWSLFRPGSWKNDGVGGSVWLPALGNQPVFVADYPAPYSLGDFAGYIHNSDNTPKPTYYSYSDVNTQTIEISGSSPVTFHVQLKRGHRIPIYDEKNGLYNYGWNNVKVFWYKDGVLVKQDPDPGSCLVIPADGSYVESQCTINISSDCQIVAAAFYSEPMGDVKYSMIEDGCKVANITALPITSLFSGVISNIQLTSSITGQCDVSLSRISGGSTRTIYTRLRITGDIQQETTVNLWNPGTWNDNETKNMNSVAFIADQLYSYGTITVNLEISLSGAGPWMLLKSENYTW